MKLIFALLFVFSTLAYAQGSADEITYTPPTKEQTEDIKGTITPATDAQKKQLQADVKKALAEKKKNKKKAKKHVKNQESGTK